MSSKTCAPAKPRQGLQLPQPLALKIAAMMASFPPIVPFSSSGLQSQPGEAPGEAQPLLDMAGVGEEELCPQGQRWWPHAAEIELEGSSDPRADGRCLVGCLLPGKAAEMTEDCISTTPALALQSGRFPRSSSSPCCMGGETEAQRDSPTAAQQAGEGLGPLLGPSSGRAHVALILGCWSPPGDPLGWSLSRSRKPTISPQRSSERPPEL